MTTFYLFLNNIKIVTLIEYEDDFPWHRCTFIPENDFDSIKHLFDDELYYFENNIKEWDKAYNKIKELNLIIKIKDSSKIIRNFLLHINNDKAWFR